MVTVFTLCPKRLDQSHMQAKRTPHRAAELPLTAATCPTREGTPLGREERHGAVLVQAWSTAPAAAGGPRSHLGLWVVSLAPHRRSRGEEAKESPITRAAGGRPGLCHPCPGQVAAARWGGRWRGAAPALLCRVPAGVLSKGRVRCPWHGACFNIGTGDIEDFPGLDSLPRFQVRPLFLQQQRESQNHSTVWVGRHL